MFVRSTWIVVLAFVGVDGVLAQDRRPPQGRSGLQDGRAMRAVRAAVPPVLDGLLTEAIWAQAEPVSDFLQKDPQEGAPASEKTEVRILFDTQHIYVGIFCSDSNSSEIRATELRRDNDFQNDDLFELILDTFHDHRNGYLFRINPLGTQYDATVTNEGQTTNTNWDEKWDARTRITEGGWSAEIVIPFKTLRFSDGDPMVWGVNFHRAIKRKNEDVFWAAHNRDFRFAEVSRAGHLEGLEGIRAFIFRVKPFFTTGGSQAVQDGRTVKRHSTDVGVEVAKYLITPQLALDLTVNPDFAQADVDDAQVNLTRFSLFFPERREFFQEGSGIFQFGARNRQVWDSRPQLLLFHSRRIGLSDNREEIPLWGGLKLTGKQGPLELGLLNMQTRRSELASGQTAPGQNFTVLRAKGNILARSYVGAMLTRNTASSTRPSNHVAGLDASFTFVRNLNVQGFLTKSSSPGLDAGQWAGMSKVEWDSDRFQFSLERLDIQENFRPEMGFVSRAQPNWKGLQQSVGVAAYKPRPRLPGVRQMEFSASVEHLANQHGLLETRDREFGWTTDFQSGDTLDFEYSQTFERLLRPFPIRGGGTVPSGDYWFNESEIQYRAFRGRKFSGSFSVSRGGFYNGKRTGLEISPQIKATRNLSFEPSYEWNKLSLPDASFTTQQLNTQVNYSFSQKWLTRTTFLLNSQDNQYAVNFRLNYIFRPGDDLFVVYNETRTYGSGSGLQNRALIVKVTYSLDY